MFLHKGRERCSFFCFYFASPPPPPHVCVCVPLQNNSSKIFSSFSVSIFYFSSLTMIARKETNTSLALHLIDLFAAGMDLTAHTTQQTTCGFQRQWTIPWRLRWKHMDFSCPFYCHFKVCLTILYAQYSKHSSTYRSQTLIWYEKTFKTDSARANKNYRAGLVQLAVKTPFWEASFHSAAGCFPIATWPNPRPGHTFFCPSTSKTSCWDGDFWILSIFLQNITESFWFQQLCPVQLRGQQPLSCYACPDTAQIPPPLALDFPCAFIALTVQNPMFGFLT